jgi:hypothetical protein
LAFPISAAAGALFGAAIGSSAKNKVTFAAEFEDGRRLMATADLKTFTQLKAASFNRKPLPTPPGKSTQTEAGQSAVVEAPSSEQSLQPDQVSDGTARVV